jgi:predicted hydrocarbon binding protein
MKGVVFEAVREVVTEVWSEDLWDDLLDDAGVDGAYVSLGSYPDAELIAIVAAASVRLDVPADDVLRIVGRRLFAQLAARVPSVMSRFSGWQDLVQELDRVIHPEVRKLYPEAITPTFEVVSRDERCLRVVYRSPRHLCVLAEGLIVGAGDHYGEDVSVRSMRCIDRGDDNCELLAQAEGA